MKAKTKFIKTALAVAAMVALLSACHRDSAIIEETDLQQFELVWNELNDSYVFWAVDSTDWDAVYAKYRPLFENMDEEPYGVWQSTWKELSSTLIDHHLEIDLVRPSNPIVISGHGSLIHPGQDEVLGRDYADNHIGSLTTIPTINEKVDMLDNIVGLGRLTDTIKSSFNNPNAQYSYSGVLEQKIAYISFSSFFDVQIDSIKAFEHFKQLVAKESIKAAIIDVRGNVGGDTKNLAAVLSCFTTDPILIGYSRAKTGVGRHDFTPEIPTIVTPLPAPQMKVIPIIVLTDILSASMSESVAVAIRQLPQSYVIGERTFGARGLLVKKIKGNHHVITLSNEIFIDAGGMIEGYGVEPDIKCLFDKNLWNSGIDNQLEMAVSVALDKILESGN